MHDAGDLSPIERLARMQLQQHRRGRNLTIAQKAGVLRQRQVNSGADHRRQRLDRARQFAFQAALVVQLLLELRQSEFLRLEYFETDHRSLGQALRGELQTGFMHLLGRHQDRAAIGIVVRNVHLGQLRDDRPAVPIREIGEQNAVGGRSTPEPGSADNGDHASRAEHHQRARAGRKSGHQAKAGRLQVIRDDRRVVHRLGARAPRTPLRCARPQQSGLFGDLRYRKGG